MMNPSKHTLRTLKVLSLSISVGILSACTSAPIQKMSAAEAIKFGNEQFFEMPSYRFDMSAKFLDFQISDSESPEKSAQFNRYLGHFGKHLTMGASGVIDTSNQRFQMIPTYGYQAKNISGSIRFPLIYDHKNQAVFADLSALTGIINSIEHDGKYSKFSTAELPIPADSDKKLVKLMRKYANVVYEDLPATAFTELPLTDVDRTQNAVRKIRIKTRPQDAFNKLPLMMNDFIQTFGGENDKDFNLPEDAVVKMKDELGKFISEDSEDVYEVAFNRKGQIVNMRSDSKYHITPQEDEPTKKVDMRMHFQTEFNVSQIGNAQLIDPPTPENTVDGQENLKGTFLGGLFNKGNKSSLDTIDAAAAEPTVPARPAKKKRPARQRK